MWWCSPVIPVLSKLRLEDVEFEASLSYIVSSCIKREKEGRKERRKERRTINSKPLG
jgi:hypothetical protein